MMENVSFGSSSFLFLIPFLYSVFNTPKTPSFTFTTWRIGLFLLTVTSFLCNYFANCGEFVLCDYSSTITLTIIYFLCFSRYNIAVFLCILFLIEMTVVHELSTTVMIAFVTLNLFAFTNFTRTELMIGIAAFSIAVYCKQCRDYTCTITYPMYTTIWHLCCAVLLVLATRSLIRA